MYRQKVQRVTLHPWETSSLSITQKFKKNFNLPFERKWMVLHSFKLGSSLPDKFLPSLVENGSFVLENIFRSCQCMYYFPLGERVWKKDHSFGKKKSLNSICPRMPCARLGWIFRSSESHTWPIAMGWRRSPWVVLRWFFVRHPWISSQELPSCLSVPYLVCSICIV